MDRVKDFASSYFQLNCVIHFDHGVRVTDSTAIVRNKERNSFRSRLNSPNFAELVLQKY